MAAPHATQACTPALLKQPQEAHRDNRSSEKAPEERCTGTVGEAAEALIGAGEGDAAAGEKETAGLERTGVRTAAGEAEGGRAASCGAGDLPAGGRGRCALLLE